MFAFVRMLINTPTGATILQSIDGTLVQKCERGGIAYPRASVVHFLAMISTEGIEVNTSPGHTFVLFATGEYMLDVWFFENPRGMFSLCGSGKEIILIK